MAEIEVYKIAVNMMVDNTAVAGPFAQFMQYLRDVRDDIKETRSGISSMTGDLRGTVSQAERLAKAMDRVASAAARGAAAMARMGVPSGDAWFPQAGGGARGGQRGGSAAPPMAPSAQLLLGYEATRMIGYDPYRPTPAPSGGDGRDRLPLIPPGPPRMLTYDAPVPSSTALTVIPGQGDSVGNGANFRRSGYAPNFTMPGAPPPPPPPPPGDESFHAPGQEPGIPLRLRSPSARSGGSRGHIFTPMHAFGAYEAWHLTKDAFEEGASVGDIKANMAAIYVAGPDGKPTRGFTDAQIAQADKLALDMQRKTPGLGYAEGLQIILKTAGNLASADSALKLAPQMGLDATVLSRLGRGDAIEQVEAAVQAGEIKGLNGPDGQIDTAKMAEMIRRLTSTAVAMGGTFNLPKYLTGLKQMGAGADAASMDFATTVLPALGKVMGEVKAGTAQASLETVLLAPSPNTRSSRYQDEQQRIGMRDAQGNLLDKGLLKSNSLDYFTNSVFPKIRAHVGEDPGAIFEEILKLFPRETVRRLGITDDKDRNLLAKEVSRNKAQQDAGDAPLLKFLQDSPGVQFKAFSESMKTLEAVATDAAMKPTLDILNKLSGTLLNISDYVKAHPGDVEQFGKDVDLIVTAMLKIGGLLAHLPAPVRDAVIGAGIGAVAGGVPTGGIGAIPGAVVGFIGGALWDAPDITGAGAARRRMAASAQSAPVAVHVVNTVPTHVTNAGDLADAASNNIARQITTAPTSAPGYQPLSTPQYPGHLGQ